MTKAEEDEENIKFLCVNLAKFCMQVLCLSKSRGFHQVSLIYIDTLNEFGWVLCVLYLV